MYICRRVGFGVAFRREARRKTSLQFLAATAVLAATFFFEEN
ncbi:hypothetical protein [Fortiea sp. LEGE XX443]|nr:hypothetical protein [Fortiea sp. LEGE XX443]